MKLSGIQCASSAQKGLIIYEDIIKGKICITSYAGYCTA